MGSLNFVDGHSRRVLFSHVTSSVTQAGSVDFGAYNVDRFSRFTGFIHPTSVGATGLTFRTRFGVNSGTWNITSTTAISSGGTTLDMINIGRVADFAITSVDSTTTYTALLLGEPLR